MRSFKTLPSSFIRVSENGIKSRRLVKSKYSHYFKILSLLFSFWKLNNSINFNQYLKTNFIILTWPQQQKHISIFPQSDSKKIKYMPFVPLIKRLFLINSWLKTKNNLKKNIALRLLVKTTLLPTGKYALLLTNLLSLFTSPLIYFLYNF